MKTVTQTKFKDTEIGSIPENWNVDSLGNISSVMTDYVANGSFASLKQNVRYSNEENFSILVRLADFNRDFRGDFVYVDERGYDFLKKTKLFGGEIIISNVGEYAGTVFRSPILNRPMTLGPNSVMLKTKYNDDFYFYWLKSKFGQDALQNIRSGSAVPKFNKTDLKKILVPIPPKDEQDKIAEIFLALDSKIEINRKIILNLKNITGNIFKKLIAFVNDELPNGWKMLQLVDYVDIDKGLSYKGSDLDEMGENVLVGLKCFERGGGFRPDGVKRFKGEFKKQNLLNPGDLIIAMTDLTQGAEVLGKPAIVPKIHNVKNIIASLDVSILRPKINLISKAYLYLFFMRQETQDYLFGFSNGSTVLHLSIDGLRKMHIPIPPTDILENFNASVEPMFKHIEMLSDEIQNLEEIRNKLFPKLMSGKLGIGKK